MSDPSAFGFGKFVPGFDFLQNLSKTASTAQPTSATGMPGMASWVAPTLSVEEIDKRIQELKSVLFWLEQNTTALKATIQAMEVQKMTLSTLQSMNVSMADLTQAFTAKAPASPAAAHQQAAPETKTVQSKPDAAKDQSQQPSKGAASTSPAVDPLQWWGALTQQFQTIAAAAVKDVAAEAMKKGMTRQGASTSTAGKKMTPAKKAVVKKTVTQKTVAKKPVVAKTPPAASPASPQAAKRKVP